MGEYPLTFAGSFVSLCCDSSEADEFVSFLFGDIPSQPPGPGADCVLIQFHKAGPGDHAVSVDGNELYRGTLGVHCAAVVYDLVIYHLLNHADSGIALHAGAIGVNDQVILLPGQSGSGKSSVTGWLSARGHSYLTDELVFIPRQASGTIQFFSRPVCLKPEVLADIQSHFSKDQLEGMLTDKDGAIIPHRSLNPRYSPIVAAPERILLPVYSKAQPLHIEQVSAAQASMSLMGCLANARNLEAHGFDQIVQLARRLPAYRVTYGSFKVLGNTLNGLLDEPTRN